MIPRDHQCPTPSWGPATSPCCRPPARSGNRRGPRPATTSGPARAGRPPTSSTPYWPPRLSPRARHLAPPDAAAEPANRSRGRRQGTNAEQGSLRSYRAGCEPCCGVLRTVRPAGPGESTRSASSTDSTVCIGEALLGTIQAGREASSGPGDRLLGRRGDLAVRPTLAHRMIRLRTIDGTYACASVKCTSETRTMNDI